MRPFLSSNAQDFIEEYVTMQSANHHEEIPEQ